MKTLLTLFDKERSELQTEVDKTTNPKQVVKLVQNRLDSLEKSYIGELSVAQVRLVKFFLDTLRQSLANVTANNETKLDTELEQITQATRSPNALILKLLQGLICIGVLASLFSLTRDTPGVWMPILLMFVLVGLEAVLQSYKDNYKSLQVNSPQPVAVAHQLVDSNILLDNLADALSTIDHAVTQTEQVKTTIGSDIEQMPEVLDFLQKLWGSSTLENPQMTVELTKLIPQILMEQGIRTQTYQASQPNLREYFEFEPSIDRSTDYVTLTPALLRGDRLLRRGRVIEPVRS